MINGQGSVQSHYHYSTNATWCEANAKVGCALKNGGTPAAGGAAGGVGGFGNRGVYGNVPSFGTAYHEYAVEFDGESHVAFAYDGKVIGNITRETRGHRPYPNNFTDVPFYLIMDFMIGQASSWSGAPKASTVFPAYLRIDSVRVAQAGTSSRSTPAVPLLREG